LKWNQKSEGVVNLLNIGDRVRVISIETGMNSIFLNKTGVIVKSNPKEYYRYFIEFDAMVIDDEARYLWWAEENLVQLEDGEESEPVTRREIKCLRCEAQMEYLKEYRFDSQDNRRGMLAAIFDYEENLVFKVFVCPKCRHTEFFYAGKVEGLDDWIDF
jgi:predicted nucleic-acid-binding Zn-ribbon protein